MTHAYRPNPSRRIPAYQQLPLWRDGNRLLLEVERAVRNFPRYHKYTLGADLRRQAMCICQAIARAAQERDAKARVAAVDTLSWRVEDFKIQVQLGKTLEAFASFAEFQRIAELSALLGKQSGGGRKRARSVAEASGIPGAAA
jgi:hypothetical protein